jgi:hypothetical protein
MKNQKGFALVLMISLLPVVMAGAACLFVFVGLLEDRIVPKNACRRHLLMGLEQISTPLRTLMNLNPQAVQLRVQMKAALSALAAATAAGNPPAMARALRWVQKVRQQQRLLDRQQKILLRSAETLLRLAHDRAGAALRQKPIGFLKTENLRPSAVRVAVRPDVPTTAPVYVFEDDFETRQTLAYEWQSRFVLRGPLANFLTASGRFPDVCAATLTKETWPWQARLNEDRFSSKRFFF